MAPIRKAAALARRGTLAQGIAAFRRLPIEPDTVLYESFAGNGMLCGPEAIYRALRADPAQAHRRHVWVLDDPAEHPGVVAELRADPRSSFVIRRSAAYWRALSTAGLLVNNATFPAEFGKRPGQVYLNTWHGTPLKTMGYDIPDGALGARNIVRNFLHADFLLSASPYMTERMYAGAYRLRNLHPGVVIEEGYPRMDRQLLSREDARSAVVASGTPLGEGRVVLLAPTWRGTSFEDPRDDSAELAGQLRELRDRLGPTWTVLVKVHQSVFRAVRRSGVLGEALVDNDVPTNVVLAATDVLVADYSSLLVDFLTLDRPIVLHTPDAAHYDATRGRYALPGSPPSPGPVLTTLPEVAACVAAVGTGGPADPVVSHAGARQTWRELLCPHEDGGATQRVLDVVLRGQREGRRVVDLGSDGRPRVLLYVGELKPNGMTSSALNLMRALDHEKVDVTALVPQPTGPERIAALAAIDPRVRVVVRSGSPIGPAPAELARQVVQRRGVARRRATPPLAAMFATEWVRCFGTARFDHVVDFIGYSPYWDLLLLQAPAQSRSIWLHNDMQADAQREVGGRQPLRRSLSAVFSLYRFFDHLVSVSPALAKVNRTRLAGCAPADRFTSAPNVIDAAGVRARAALPDEATPPAPPGTVTFVAAGRLSSAKNLPRLVEAFAHVHAQSPATRLLLLGDGPDRPALEAQIAASGAAEAIVLAGHQDNPFPAMAAADCYVMSSDHEGQPMVLLEALVLGLPVVTTRFASVDSALPPGQGRVVERSVEGVAEGLRAFLRGEVPPPDFDPQAYNRQAVSSFYEAIGLEKRA